MRRSAYPAVAALTALAACAPTSRAPAPAPSTEVTAEELRRDLAVFASDSFAGREVGTPGERRAVAFLESRLRAYGVQPAGDSGYLQRVPLVRQSLGRGTRFVLTNRTQQQALRVGEQLVPLLQLGPGMPPPRLDVEGDVVFAGYGLQIPQIERDDLRGLDLKGKVVVVVNGAPAGVDSMQAAQLAGQPGLGLRLATLMQHQPAAVIVLLRGDFAEQFETARPELLESMMLASDARDVPASERTMPMLLLGLERDNQALLPPAWPNDDRAQPLVGRRFSGHVELERTPVAGYNVVGVVPGSDPALRGSYVAYGAHLDHIGVEPAVAGDTIANGADDDGSGSVALLGLARAFAQSPQRPRRSMLFVWHTAEEKGLLGSRHFTDHPTVPLDSIVAQINADMIGRNGRDSIHVVGPAAAPEGQSRVLGAVADSANASLANPFVFLREYDSPSHPEQIYYRSDHYNYARKGIPVLFFTTGLHDDYHEVGDEVAKIDYEKLAHVARLFRAIGERVGNSPARPVAR